MAPLRPFGQLPDGREVRAIDLTLGETRATILDHGARLAFLGPADGANLCVPPAGADTLETTDIYHGPVIAPVINRLRGAAAMIDGRQARFEANQHALHTLHVGRAGSHLKIWEVTQATPQAATLTLTLPDGEGGFPGTRRITAAYSLPAPGTLRLTLTATTDRPTLMNPGLHPVFACPPGTMLSVPAERYLPTDADALPTGQIAPVAGSPHDFRQPRAPGGDTDHNFCFDAPGLRARLTHGDGRWLEIRSDAPGLQVYDGYGDALALEPQLWPDAPANPDFPSILLRPGAVFSQTSDYVTGRG